MLHGASGQFRLIISCLVFTIHLGNWNFYAKEYVLLELKFWIDNVNLDGNNKKILQIVTLVERGLAISDHPVKFSSLTK